MKFPSRIVFAGVSKSGKSTLGDFLAKNYDYQVTAFADPLKRAVKQIFGFDDAVLYGPAENRDRHDERFLFSGFCLTCQRQCSDPSRLLVPVPMSSDAVSVALAKEIKQIAKLVTDTKRDSFWLCTKCGATYPKYVSCRLALQTMGTEWGRTLCNDIWIQACFGAMKPEWNYVVTDGRFYNEVDTSLKNGCVVILLMRGLQESTSTHSSETEIVELAKYSPEIFSAILDNSTGSVEENCAKLVELLETLGQDEPNREVETP